MNTDIRILRLSYSPTLRISKMGHRFYMVYKCTDEYRYTNSTTLPFSHSPTLLFSDSPILQLSHSPTLLILRLSHSPTLLFSQLRSSHSPNLRSQKWAIDFIWFTNVQMNTDIRILRLSHSPTLRISKMGHRFYMVYECTNGYGYTNKTLRRLLGA